MCVPHTYDVCMYINIHTHNVSLQFYMLLEATLQKELLCNFGHKVILKIEPVLKSVHKWTENNHNTNKCGEIEFQQAKVFNNTPEWKIIF